jgi:hypothetical protein
MVLEIKEFQYEPDLEKLYKLETEKGRNPRHLDLFQLDDNWIILIFYET